MKKTDFIIIGFILIIVIAGFGFISAKNNQNKGNDRIVDIMVDGKLYKSIKIGPETDEKFTVKSPKGENTIHIHENGVEVIDATCPDKICVHTGFIDQPSEVIVCLPNKVVVELHSEGEEAIDGVSQ